MGTTIFDSDLRKANKNYHCVWCGEEIKRGWFHRVWSFISNGQRVTKHVHSECGVAWLEADRSKPGFYEACGYGRHYRGCSCRRSDGCSCGQTTEQKRYRGCVKDCKP